MRMVPAALVVALLAWIVVMFAATGSEMAGAPPPPPPILETVELDIGLSSPDTAKARYSALIETLRAKLQGGSHLGIPMLRQPSSAREYILLNLISAQKNPVRLAIRKRDVYVVGYSYKVGKELRARFFKDIIKNNEYGGIFDDAKNKDDKDKNIGYEGSYPNIQGEAGVGDQHDDRRSVALGMETLGGFIDTISKPNQKKFSKIEAKILLISIQMFCEAVRFKYIEKLVKDNIPYDVYPDHKVISLERKWDVISTAIANVQSEAQRFTKDLELENADGEKWVVKTVKDIKADMGLLNYVKRSELPDWPIWMQLDHNVPVAAQ